MNNSGKNIFSEPAKCPKCGTGFHCSTFSKCWCYEVDVPSEVMEDIEKEFDGCLCPDCLKEFSK